MIPLGRGDAAPSALLGLLTLGELRITERLLFVDARQYGFVLESIRGVLAGTPVSKSWQHRVLSPNLLHVLERVTHSPLSALRTFTFGMMFVANFVLFLLVRKRGSSPWEGFAVCAAFGFARCLCTYKLEYPWDELDVVLFMIFGYAVSSGASLGKVWPLILLGAFNHETVLCLPAWFVLTPLEPKGRRHPWRDALFGAATWGALACGITYLRNALYLGQPALKDQVFETAAPVVENHVHVSHNLRQLFYADWVEGRMFIGATFLLVCIVLAVCIARRVHVRAAVWTFGFLATVVAFGYVNETRHYLSLLAFWFAYAGPSLATALAAPRVASQ